MTEEDRVCLAGMFYIVVVVLVCAWAYFGFPGLVP